MDAKTTMTPQEAARDPYISIYRDAHTGGWVYEVRPYTDSQEWHRVGVYGTREAALAAATR